MKIDETFIIWIVLIAIGIWIGKKFVKYNNCKKKSECAYNLEKRYCKKCKTLTCHVLVQIPPEGDWDFNRNNGIDEYICECCDTKEVI